MSEITPYDESEHGYYLIIDVEEQYVMLFEIDSLYDPMLFTQGIN